MDEENKYERPTPHGEPRQIVRPNVIYYSGLPPLYSSYPSNPFPYYSSAEIPLHPAPPHPQFQGFTQPHYLPQQPHYLHQPHYLPQQPHYLPLPHHIQPIQPHISHSIIPQNDYAPIPRYIPPNQESRIHQIPIPVGYEEPSFHPPKYGNVRIIYHRTHDLDDDNNISKRPIDVKYRRIANISNENDDDYNYKYSAK